MCSHTNYLVVTPVANGSECHCSGSEGYYSGSESHYVCQRSHYNKCIGFLWPKSF